MCRRRRSRARIEWLERQIAELKQAAEKDAAPVKAIQHETRDAGQAQIPPEETPAR